jgi:hypothetical protein
MASGAAYSGRAARWSNSGCATSVLQPAVSRRRSKPSCIALSQNRGSPDPMRRLQSANAEQRTDEGPDRLRGTERRNGIRREADLAQRLAEVEALALANRHELNLQFQRMAHMQADLDRALRSTHSMPSRSLCEQMEVGDQESRSSGRPAGSQRALAAKPPRFVNDPT